MFDFSNCKTKLIHRNNQDHDIRRRDMCLVKREFQLSELMSCLHDREIQLEQELQSNNHRMEWVWQVNRILLNYFHPMK